MLSQISSWNPEALQKLALKLSDSGQTNSIMLTVRQTSVMTRTEKKKKILKDIMIDVHHKAQSTLRKQKV